MWSDFIPERFLYLIWKADILINANVLDSGTCSELLIHGC
jgi:hypothetical protein